MPVIAVIPARYGSTRFPGKPLALLRGRPLILHAWDRAREARSIDRAIVATDDERIADAVRRAGGEAAMTSPDCASGSDRAAEVARARPDAEIVVNLQGDEPNLDPTVIDRVVEALIAAPDCAVATAAAPIRDETEFLSPHVVKVVLDAAGRALYFSRSPLPSPARLAPADRAPPDFIWGLKHLGLYAFRREALLDFAAAAPAPLERRESLEQLRLLERGARIKVVRVEADSIGVDTPADLERLQRSASASRSAPRAPRAKE